jgi:copper chaperone CopZ
MEYYELRISGMHCEACGAAIRRSLENAGYEVVMVDVAGQKIFIRGQQPEPERTRDVVRAAGDYDVKAMVPAASGEQQEIMGEKAPRTDYVILATALVLITVTSFLAAWNLKTRQVSWMSWMHGFMAGFFLLFGFVKLMDLRAFARTFARYDLVAGRLPLYGLIYPFMEILVGWLYILVPHERGLNAFCLAWMLLGATGALRGLLRQRGEPVACACMGSRIRLPLSWITVAEYLLMALMALPALFP